MGEQHQGSISVEYVAFEMSLIQPNTSVKKAVEYMGLFQRQDSDQWYKTLEVAEN